MIERVLLFSLLSIIGFVFFIWIRHKGLEQIRVLPDFSDRERTALQRQINALLGFPVAFIVVCIFLVFFEKPWPFYADTIPMVIVFISVGYICVSSIQNRVSLLRSHHPLPVKGATAVRNGVLNLAFLVLAFSACLLLSIFHE
jgi:hypothetical protein